MKKHGLQHSMRERERAERKAAKQVARKRRRQEMQRALDQLPPQGGQNPPGATDVDQVAVVKA